MPTLAFTTPHVYTDTQQEHTHRLTNTARHRHQTARLTHKHKFTTTYRTTRAQAGAQTGAHAHVHTLALPRRTLARARGRPHPVHLPSIGPEGEAALPAAHGAAAAAARLPIWPVRSRSRLPRARVTLATRAAPPPGHKPRDCPRPRRLQSSCGGQPRAERAACSRRPPPGGGSFAGLSQLGFQGRAWLPSRWRNGVRGGGGGEVVEGGGLAVRRD